MINCCDRPAPYVDGDEDTVCRNCRRVLKVGPLGINGINYPMGRTMSVNRLWKEGGK